MENVAKTMNVAAATVAVAKPVASPEAVVAVFSIPVPSAGCPGRI